MHYITIENATILSLVPKKQLTTIIIMLPPLLLLLLVLSFYQLQDFRSNQHYIQYSPYTFVFNLLSHSHIRDPFGKFRSLIFVMKSKFMLHELFYTHIFFYCKYTYNSSIYYQQLARFFDNSLTSNLNNSHSVIYLTLHSD